MALSTRMTQQNSQSEQWLSMLPAHLRERTRSIAKLHRSTERCGSGTHPAAHPAASRSPIVYWTHHAQRVDENPALEVACTLAEALKRPLVVYHGLSSEYRYASDRHHVFQLQAAKDLQEAYRERGIRYAFHLQTRNDPTPSLVLLAQQTDLLITDDFPGEPTDRWLKRLAHLSHLTILAVDTACVVPMQLVGQAFDRAFAFRDATKKLYQERVSRVWPVKGSTPEYFDGQLPLCPLDLKTIEPYKIVAYCDIDPMVPPVSDTRGGTRAGYARWESFLKHRIDRYAAKRNDPCTEASSRMSAYLHYGMVSPMRLAREAHERRAEKYLDELLIWREIAYGYCFYRSDYQSLTTLPTWAVETLRKHQMDRRDQLYSWERLARGQTDDPLWNACQQSLLKHGELHNNVRMTWGKSLLQWTDSPEQALAWLIDLNHRYALDGRDPASYGGILWCLGQFDRPFYPEQQVLGTVRPRPTSEHLGRLDLKKYQTKVNRPIAGRACKIAVVGAGLSGLLCARTIADMGLEVEVFEKSRGAAGRAATRRLDSGGSIDHGAPFFEVPSKRFEPLLQSWQQESIISRWEPRLAKWSNASGTASLSSCSLGTSPMWVGQGGMKELGKHLAQSLKVRCRSTVESIKRDARGWSLQGTLIGDDSSTSSIDSGPFDCVVLAIPSPQAAAILDQDCSWKQVACSQKMKPTWALLVEFERVWDIPLDAIAFENHPCLDWISRESSKPGRSGKPGGSGPSAGSPSGDLWSIHANHDWSNQQIESNPEFVVQSLMQAVGQLGFGPIPGVLSVQSHRWRYAQAAESSLLEDRQSPCLWDGEQQIGACGDWIYNTDLRGFLGRSLGVARALESGAAMAGEILRHWMGVYPTGETENAGKQAFQPMLFGDEAY
ncbi:MAG: FAD-dependent oxidoreductase [Planctomycetota bacterium]